MFNYIYDKQNWKKFNKNILSLLERQSVTITGLPFSGMTSYHRHILSKLSTSNKKQIIIDISFIEETDILNKLKRHLEGKIDSTKRLNDIREIIKRELNFGNEFIFCIDRIQNIKHSKKNQQLLQNIRALNPVRVKFFTTCDISILTTPKNFLSLGSVISENIIPTKINNLNDTVSLVKSFSKQYNWEINEKYYKRIHRLTGGLIGLVKSVCNYIHDENDLEKDLNLIIKKPNMNFKISEIKQVLKSNKLIKENKLDFNKLDLLTELGLIDNSGIKRIELLNYSKSEIPPDKESLKKQLTLQENELFSHLETNKDKITSPEEIGEILWKEKVDQKFSLWAIYKVIANLRKKLEPFGYKITNYHGRGYSLSKT